MYEDTKVSQLVINHLTEEKFKELLENDELDQNQLYMTDDNVGYTPPLLDFKWADHLLNDISWLRADTFSWHDGEMYKAAYNHLVADFENAEINHWYAWGDGGGGISYTKTPTVAVGDTVYNDDFSVFGQVEWVSSSGTNFAIGTNEFIRTESNDITVRDTETIAGIEITYYRAEDGHKICLPDQEDKLFELYNATGVAWYYILDEDNTQFKLPRTKFGFTGLRDSVGNYVPESLPNITGVSKTFSHQRGASDSFEGALYNTYGTYYGEGSGSNNTGITLHLDASLSSPTYQDNAPVQERATQTYLYFYVGNFERDAVEQTAGVTTETLNGKADSDLGNIPANYDYVVESQLPTEENGYTWYRKYKSGWVEQGGTTTATGSYVTTTFPVAFSNDKYTLFAINHRNTTGAWSNRFGFDKTATGFTWVADSGVTEDWRADGMSA